MAETAANPLSNGHSGAKMQLGDMPQPGASPDGPLRTPGGSFMPVFEDESHCEMGPPELSDAAERDDAVATLVMPESLETEAGTQEVETWKESLVEHAVKGKENARARRKRVSRQILNDGSMIDPDGRFRRKWDLCQMLLLIYVAFGVPYRLGFSQPVQLWTPFFWFDLCVDMYFIIDIGLSFKTAYFNDLGDLVVDPKMIRRHYVKTWFTIDLSSCFPGNYISYAMSDDGGSNSSKMIRLLRMLRLLKLLRLARINRLLQRYEEEFASLMTTFKLGKLCAVIIIIGHFLSCLFFGIGSYESEHPDELGLDVDGNEHVGWVYRQFDIEKCPPGSCMMQKYITSFYWACMTMTTVGYGDIVPKTIYETCAVIVAMVIGGFVFGIIVGNLAELSKRANAGELQRQKYVSNASLMLLSGTMKGSVRTDTERKVKAYHNNVYDRRTSRDILEYFSVLPVQLRDELAQQIHWIDGWVDDHEVFGLLHKVPFFSGLSNSACIAICARMKPLVVMPVTEEEQRAAVAAASDPLDLLDNPAVIMAEGMTGQTSMYFVIEGSNTVALERRGIQLGKLSSGDFFGELAALLPPELEEHKTRTRTAYAVGETQLGVLDYEDVLELRRSHAEISQRIVTYVNHIAEHLPGVTEPPMSMIDAFPELQLVTKHTEANLAELDAKLEQIIATMKQN